MNKFYELDHSTGMIHTPEHELFPEEELRARISCGFTQEALAECSGYSADSIRSWESGARTASMEALGILSECLQSPWLTAS